MESTLTVEAVADAVLASLDLGIAVDTSGSMGDASLRMPGKNRLEEVREDCIAIAREAGKHDADGLTLVAFSTAINTKDGVTADKVAEVFAEYSPRGGTNLAGCIDELTKKAKGSSKEFVGIIFTDGAPSDEAAAIEAITRAGNELGRPKIGFVFVQVGTDRGATDFLKKLDTEMKVDVCATVSAAAAEGLSLAQLVWLARNK